MLPSSFPSSGKFCCMVLSSCEERTPLPCCRQVKDRMEILEGLLRAHPSAGDDMAALLEVAALLGLGDRSEEAELLVAQARL